MTEEDTFKALSRKPFEDVIYDMTHCNESISTAYKIIINKVAHGDMIPRHDWDKFSGGWSFEDFKNECIKRHADAYTTGDISAIRNLRRY